MGGVFMKQSFVFGNFALCNLIQALLQVFKITLSERIWVYITSYAGSAEFICFYRIIGAAGQRSCHSIE